MHAPIIINDNDIEYAEQILLRQGQFFDEERVTFIKDLTTLDLQAVPGSGKTTALLAKLLILDKYLPFKEGSGILILSHTNAAINEIRNCITKHCKYIFSYPNYIGTIQSFIDNFLTIPYFKMMIPNTDVVIDDEKYYAKHYIPHGAKAYFSNKSPSQQKDLLYDCRIIKERLSFIDGRSYLLKDEQSLTYKAIYELKHKLKKSGVLSFYDAYLLANEYLESYPNIKDLIQLRFPIIFVDEMQDVNAMQFDLLENLFFE